MSLRCLHEWPYFNINIRNMHRHTDQLYVLLILTNLINVSEDILTITNEMHHSDFDT